ncbi:MAG: alpha/beta hydrolase family protein [Acetobacteraceae bacterium]
MKDGSTEIEDTADAPAPFTLQAEDGFLIKGFCWRHARNAHNTQPVVVINPATSVRCRYYSRFAAFLFRHGLDVITYDYRGIGESRPQRLRGFNAHWIDWGYLDFEAALQFARLSFHDQPVDVVAHSVGGLVLGFAPSNDRIRRVVTVGAQYAYWPDYAEGHKLRMLAKWHVAMPLITMLFGYFPGRRLGWLEDTPSGVVRDWAVSHERFEDTWRHHALAHYRDAAELVRQFSALNAPILALSITDDEFGTVPAIERLLAYFDHSPRTHLRISPQSIGETAIGHFGFFNSRLEQKLWQIPLEWLKSGRLPVGCPGVLITSARSAHQHQSPTRRST